MQRPNVAPWVCGKIGAKYSCSLLDLPLLKQQRAQGVARRLDP
jgi:hypothetical protein